MALAALLHRAAAFVLRPQEEWQRLATEPRRGGAVVAHALLLSAIGPVVLTLARSAFSATTLPASGLSPMTPGSPMDIAIRAFVFPGIPGLALPGQVPGPAENLLAGLALYVQNLACIGAGGVMLRLLAPWCGGRRDLGASLQACAYGLTPLLISEVGLASPSLLLLLAIGGMHSCYVVHTGVCRLLGLSDGDGAMLLGLSALLLLGVLPVLGAAMSL